MKTVRIGLLGCGTVGNGFVRLVERERDRIAAQHGIALEITRILVRDPARERLQVDPRLVTTSAIDVIDSECEVLVELVGGVHAAGAFVRRALARGVDVVTANKALLAACGPELFALAEKTGAQIGFEASVCGALPIIGVLRGMTGDRIDSITAILNATCNFILTRMEEGDLDLDAATAIAQQHGFAEADPSLDVDGTDAAQKLQILAGIAFGGADAVRLRVQGIRDVRKAEVEQARSRGCAVRLVAAARRLPGGVELRVELRELPLTHPLAIVKDEDNAVIVRGRAAGEMLFRGKGAGSLPTATAVLADVVGLAKLAKSGVVTGFSPSYAGLKPGATPSVASNLPRI